MKLHGLLDEQKLGPVRLQAHARILGKIQGEGVGVCTLLDTQTRGVSLGATRRMSVIATLALLGAELPKARDLRFSLSSVSLGNLEEWLGWRPIKHEYSPLTLRYEKPSSLHAKLPSIKARLEIKSTIENEPESWQRDSLIHSARMTITIERGMQRRLEWHLDTLAALRDLVTLFSGSPSWFRVIEVTKAKGDDAALVAGVSTTKPRNRVLVQRMFLPLSKVTTPFESLIERWFAHRVEHEAAHHLLFSAFYERMAYGEFAFLAAMQALETYGRKRLAPKCSPKKRIGLADCITEVLDVFESRTQRRLFKASTGFKDRIRHTRNYFTHYSKDKAAKAYRGNELRRATARVRLLLTLAFMKDLGVDEKVLREYCLKTWYVAFELKWRG